MSPAQYKAKIRMHQNRLRQSQSRLNSELRRIERERQAAIRRLRNSCR